MNPLFLLYLFFFFNDTATTEIYTLSLHDALPIWICAVNRDLWYHGCARGRGGLWHHGPNLSCLFCAAADRKSTRLNSSHQIISYAVFCLKKKKEYRTFITFIHDGYVTYKYDSYAQ